MRTRALIVALCLVVSGGLAGSLAAQESMLLRYQPRERLVVRSVSRTDVEMKMALGGLMGMIAAIGEGLAEALGADTSEVSVRDSIRAAVAQLGEDSITIQMEIQQYLTDQVLEARAGRYTVYRTVDSTRARTRAEGEPWENAPRDDFPRSSAQLVLDDRLQIQQFQTVAPDSVDDMMKGMLRAPHGGMLPTLPAEPISPGQSWTAEMAFPFNLGQGMEMGEGASLGGGELISQARFLLDSLVDRGPDTLAYIRVWGTFEPTAAPQLQGVEGSADIDGKFGGMLIWSTAWNTFVSGSSRTELTLDVRLGAPGAEAEAGGMGFGAQFIIANRFQVRP